MQLKDKRNHCDHHCDVKKNRTCVSLVPIFNHLDENQMIEISKIIQSIQYRKGEFLYRSGEQSDSLYIVRKGRVKNYRISETGKEQILRILYSGDFTGELALFNESNHESYAEAMEETQVCSMKRADLHSLIERYPNISFKFFSELSRRLEWLEKQITRFAGDKMDTRIALFLAECVDDKNQSNEFVLPMSKKDLASYLGTTPETISRKMHEFETAGFIKQNILQKKIVILDRKGLLEI
ncbi:Crp/Fnr family transcriptional regulator [Pectinatus frisingensis]|uniref:Crp/Fnr family transcriptional regulator n=1 Tax=Pectinatus frisingensis TaxID=865 RepID=UPI0015F5D3FF|nr:Crp/Fnr family transcriptional regulator [Pectinatus frisingensis]